MRGWICKNCCSRLPWNITVASQGKTFYFREMLAYVIALGRIE